MKISKKNKYILFILLIILNIILRIPSYQHQTGYDSFATSILANIVSLFGYAGWWIHPLSIFGMYPYSYASAVPFLLSGISQLSVLDMEITVLVFDVLTGLLSIFITYLLAGMIKNDDIFKFFVAFGASTAQGMLIFTTWDVSTRGLFIVILPLFIYLLLKVRVNKIRAGMLAAIIFVLLASIHHYIYFTFPVILSFLIVAAATKASKSKNFQWFYIERINRNDLLNICYLVLFFIFFSYPFISQSFITAGSRYGWLIDVFIINFRYTGPLILFAFVGFTYLVLKHNKRFEDWFLLIILVFFAPFLYIQTYMHFIILIFLFLLIGISLTNITQTYKQKRKYVTFVIIASILLSISFSGFYQHWHTGMKGGRSDWWMTHETYTGGKWIKEGINSSKSWASLGVEGFRMFAISGGLPPMVCDEACGISYGFLKLNYSEIIANSPFSIDFYWDNPYVMPPGKTISGKLNWLSAQNDIDYAGAKSIIKSYDISYIVEGSYRYPLLESVHRKGDNVYDSGTIKIWMLNKKDH